jgi:hypothetical protein
VTGKKYAGKWIFDPPIIPRLNPPESENRRSAKRNHVKLHDIVVVTSQEVETFNGKSTANIQQPHLSVGQGFHHEADHRFSQSAVLTGQQ